MWVLLFPVREIPGDQKQLQFSLSASVKGLQHLAQMGLDSVDRNGHFLRDFHIAVTEAGVSGRILLAGGQAVPTQEVVVGGVVFANGKGEQPVDGLRNREAFFFGYIFDEGNEVGVYFSQGLWPDIAVLLEDVI